MKGYVTIGVAVLAGAALVEAALVPGLLIGAAALLGPGYVRRRVQPAVKKMMRKVTEPAAAHTERVRDTKAPFALPNLRVGRAVAKTITFRIVVTSLDFSVNLLVLGEIGTAAGLSTFNLVAGPLYYLGHEAAWSYFGPPESEGRVTVHLRSRSDAGGDGEGREQRGFTVSRAIAKTVTFRTLATIADFTANFVVVGDVGTAVVLTSSGFFLGPFVYWGHEKAWEYFGSPQEQQEPLALPAPKDFAPAFN
jgi:uncharacterized membrane protein